MNKRLLVLGVLLIIVLVGWEGDALAVKRTVLPNGLVILTKPVTTNSIVSVVVSLRMGSLYESDEEAGLCALMQETIRKGTTNRTSDQIALELESMGTRLSASSVREYGTIGIQSTAASLDKSLEILIDLMTNATFPEDAVELQKTLQIQNILSTYDEPIYYAMDLMVDAHFGTHPFHKPRMGYPEKIETFTRDDLVNLYHRIYVPNNMVVSVVGNFDEAELIATITSTLGTVTKGNDVVPSGRDDSAFAGRMTTVEKIDQRAGSATWYALGWSAPKLGDPDAYVMEVLDSITGGSMNSRLFIAIREKRGLAYQVSSFLNSRREAGIYVAYIGTNPATYEESKQVLIEEVQRMGTEQAPDDEVTLAKNYLRGMHIMGQESNADQAALYAHYEVIGVGYEYLESYPEKIDAVTAEDILRVGAEFLKDNYALGAVLAEE